MKQKTTAMLPLYRKVKNYIIDQIDSGELKPQQKIPSENQLVRIFGISRMTVNRAVRELTDEGFLVRLAGVGTFVAEIKVQSHLLEVHDIADEITARGHAYSRRVIEHDFIVAKTDILSRMAVSAATPVFHCLILHFEQYVPIQLENRYVNPVVFPGFGSVDLTKTTPYEYLMRVAPLQRAEHVVSAISPKTSVRAALELKDGEACLLLERRTWVKDKVATYVQLYHPGPRYSLKDQFTRK
ncbi:MAG: histidine utilization repressor [Alphaproteobacteria bacterium]|nr:histidine utilization repressor [Alphaproteobacteria bacterium]